MFSYHLVELIKTERYFDVGIHSDQSIISERRDIMTKAMIMNTHRIGYKKDKILMQDILTIVFQFCNGCVFCPLLVVIVIEFSWCYVCQDIMMS